MHRLHTIIPRIGGPMPPSGERAAITKKAIDEAPNRRLQEEAARMGNVLSHAKKKEDVSIK
jgi:hypothetical protein